MTNLFAQTSSDLPDELNKFLGFADQKTYKDMIHNYNEAAYSSTNHENKLEVPLMAPESRSLQKNKINYKNPRIVYAQQDSKMFLAYAPEAKQAEVIVWNNEKSKYEFYILENFTPGNKKQKINAVKQDKSKCTSCHQNEGPLWTRGGWDAYQSYWNKHFGQSVSMGKILKARNGNHFYQGFDLSKDFGGGPDAPAFVDEKIRAAARKLQKSVVCKTVCGDNLECKTELLLISLGRKEISESFIQRLVQLWPESGFGYPSSVIPDPFTSIDNKMEIGVVAQKDFTAYDALNKVHELEIKTDSRPFKSPLSALSNIPNQMNPNAQGEYELTYDEESSSLGGVLAVGENEFVKINHIDPKPGNQGDPLYKRPIVGIIRKQFAAEYLNKNLSSCFNFSDEEKNKVKNKKNNELKRIFEVRLTANPELWNEKIRTLLNNTTNLIINQNCAECSLSPPPVAAIPVTSKVVDKIYNKRSAIQFFTHYCTDCHSGTDAVKLLPLDNIHKMKMNKNVRDYLQSKTMPPSSAKIQPSDEERNAVLDFLNH